MTDHGDGGIPGANNLMQPPAYKEGVGGGPAFPVAVISNEEKAEYDVLSDLSTVLAAFLGMGAAGSALWGPVGMEVGVVLGLSSGAFALLGFVASDLAEDPPQPAYARPVVFKQRLSNPPPAPDPALEPMCVGIQQGVFGTVTGKGYLDSVERLQGAQQANDLPWALVQRGVANLARQQLIVDIANVGAAIYAAGSALKGTKFDLELAPGADGAKQWIEKRGHRTALAKGLLSSGQTTAEINRVISFFKSDPTYTGPASSLSEQITRSAEKIYGVATRLHALT